MEKIESQKHTVHQKSLQGARSMTGQKCSRKDFENENSLKSGTPSTLIAKITSKMSSPSKIG
jgi:hypothetical protein